MTYVCSTRPCTNHLVNDCIVLSPDVSVTMSPDASKIDDCTADLGKDYSLEDQRNSWHQSYKTYERFDRTQPTSPEQKDHQ